MQARQTDVSLQTMGTYKDTHILCMRYRKCVPSQAGDIWGKLKRGSVRAVWSYVLWWSSVQMWCTTKLYSNSALRENTNYYCTYQCGQPTGRQLFPRFRPQTSVSQEPTHHAKLRSSALSVKSFIRIVIMSCYSRLKSTFSTLCTLLNRW